MRMARKSRPVDCLIHKRQFWVSGDLYRRGGHMCPECLEEERLMGEAARELRAEGIPHARVDQALARAEAKAGKKFMRYANVGR